MFLNRELKDIQEAKSRLVICCDLRRRLFHIEVRSVGYGVRHTLSSLTLGLAVAEQILGFLRERKKGNRC